jgi:NCAIR mutase (PurE)-related protein
MNREQLGVLLDRFRSGELSKDDFLEELARWPYRVLPDARVDTHRALRQGAAEVVLGQGKTAPQIVQIVKALVQEGGNLLVTRITADTAREVLRELPVLTYHAEARVLTLRQEPLARSGVGTVAVVTA